MRSTKDENVTSSRTGEKLSYKATKYLIEMLPALGEVFRVNGVSASASVHNVLKFLFTRLITSQFLFVHRLWGNLRFI